MSLKTSLSIYQIVGHDTFFGSILNFVEGEIPGIACAYPPSHAVCEVGLVRGTCTVDNR